MTRKIRLQKPASDRLRERFERDLNEAQREAATAPDGFNLILAGPGSGKTRVITYRVAYLIARGVAAESILLVTFTRRAAREMVGRLETLIGPTASRSGPAPSTTSATASSGGRRRRSATTRTSRSSTARTSATSISLAMDDAGLVGTGSSRPKPAAVQHLISFAFNVGRPLAEVVADRHPDWSEWAEQIEAAAAPTRAASGRPTAWTTTTCSASGRG